MLTAIVGVNWGDEGKGRMVDLLSSDYAVVVRYHGGSTAEHTVINDRGRYVLNLLPSGILREDTVNVMGPGMVIDPEHLCAEISHLREKGIAITPDNLKISDRATVVMPYHRREEALEAARRGITPPLAPTGNTAAYADKYSRMTLRMGDLLRMQDVEARLSDILERKNLTLTGVYGAAAEDYAETLRWIERYGAPLRPYICDAGAYLERAARHSDRILLEAPLGALRDIDFGVYPYTSASSGIAASAPIGAGVPWMKVDHVIGIMKAYSSSPDDGPFPCEITGEEAERLRIAGGEFRSSGRPSRVGGFDCVASRYGVKIQGANEIALTKLDVLSYQKEIPVCVAYSVDGERVTQFPVGEALFRAKPIYQTFPGFMCDISGCRRASDLPSAARRYIEFLENAVDCPIKYVSVGAERGEYIKL